MHAKRAALKPSESNQPLVPWQQPHLLGSRHYGLPDARMPLHVHEGAQTVDQEFRMYSMATLSSKGTNILGFWQVSVVYLKLHLLSLTTRGWPGV